MVPDDHDEVDMNDFDPENDRQQHRWDKLLNIFVENSLSSIPNFTDEATAGMEVMTMMMMKAMVIMVPESSALHSRGIRAICLRVINIQN